MPELLVYELLVQNGKSWGLGHWGAGGGLK